MRRIKFSTVLLLTKVFGNNVLATQYEQFKSNPGSLDFKSTVAKIEVKLTIEWEKAKNDIKKIEGRSVRSGKDLQLDPMENDKEDYTKNKNVLSLIKKLQKKFSININ